MAKRKILEHQILQCLKMNSPLHDMIIKCCVSINVIMAIYAFFNGDAFLFLLAFSSLSLFLIGSAIKNTVDKQEE